MPRPHRSVNYSFLVRYAGRTPVEVASPVIVDSRTTVFPYITSASTTKIQPEAWSIILTTHSRDSGCIYVPSTTISKFWGWDDGITGAFPFLGMYTHCRTGPEDSASSEKSPSRHISHYLLHSALGFCHHRQIFFPELRCLVGKSY